MKNSIIATLIALVLTTSMLSACTNREVGTASGAVIGGVAGSALTRGSTAGTIVGAVGGGYIGNQLAR